LAGGPSELADLHGVHQVEVGQQLILQLGPDDFVIQFDLHSQVQGEFDQAVDSEPGYQSQEIVSPLLVSLLIECLLQVIGPEVDGTEEEVSDEALAARYVLPVVFCFLHLE